MNQRYISANPPKSNEPAIYLSQRYIPNNVTLKRQKRVAFYDRCQPSARPRKLFLEFSSVQFGVVGYSSCSPRVQIQSQITLEWDMYSVSSCFASFFHRFTFFFPLCATNQNRVTWLKRRLLDSQHIRVGERDNFFPQYCGGFCFCSFV